MRNALKRPRQTQFFGKIGRSASEEVVLQLVVTKCLPILIYGSKACCLIQSNISSLDFAVNRFLMKLFKTANVNVKIAYLFRFQIAEYIELN
jgi:hypothetical protein